MNKTALGFLTLCLFISLNVFGQQSLRYRFVTRKVDNKKINILKSGTDSLVVQPVEKTKSGYKRSFSLSGQSYYWLTKGGQSKLYKGDTVIATATKTLIINGRTYKIKQKGTRRYTYLTSDKKEVVKGDVSKVAGVLMVDIVFPDSQHPDLETLRVTSTYFGLSMVEARKRKLGVILASTAGFMLGYALGSAAAN